MCVRGGGGFAVWLGGLQVPHWRDKMGPEYRVMQLIFAWRAVNATGCNSQ